MSRVARLAAASLPLALAIVSIAGAVERRATPPAFAAVSAGGRCSSTTAACSSKEHAASSVALHVAVGFGDQYRASAWLPVHVMVENRGPSLLKGTVAIPDSGPASQYASPQYDSLYQARVTVEPGGARQVTLYMPGPDVNGAVTVQLRIGSRVVATAVDAPSVFDDSTITVGALTSDPFAVAWLRAAQPRNASIALNLLTTRALDTVPQALANFDAIVLTNIDASRLVTLQMRALEQYVQDGGSLVLVGGPNGQQTLGSLPAPLVPGVLAGSRVLNDLSGLQLLAGSLPPRQSTIVNLLAHPRGAIAAEQNGVPLVVREAVGKGRILYLAFDPAIAPISGWTGATSLFTELVRQATPQVGARLAISSGSFLGGPGFRFGPSSMRRELANVPDALAPTFRDLLLVVALAIFILGPLNFLILSLVGKRELAWVALPALALLLLTSTLFAASRLEGSLTLVNTASLVELNGSTSSHPITLYAGLFAPVSGSYRLVWHGRGLAQGAPDYGFRATTASDSVPFGVRLQEGENPVVTFPSMSMWSSRSVAITTTVTIRGTVHGNLHVAPNGSIAGVVRNDTDLTLHACAVLAGNAFLRLPDLPPGTTHSVHLVPHVDLNAEDLPEEWDQVYKTTAAGPAFGDWDGDPWEEPDPAKESSLMDRVRNIAERLPEAQDITALGEVLFTGWSDRPLGRLTVDGASPHRRDLTLLVAPLSVHLERGSFRLRPGTLGASLVDVVPAAPVDGCCPSPLATQPIDLGPGGSATFQFDLPDAGRVYFRKLIASVNAGGADSSEIGQAYDWRLQRWVHVNLPPYGAPLPEPQRFISPTGAVLLRLHASAQSGDIVINDPHQDLQLSGWGTVR